MIKVVVPNPVFERVTEMMPYSFSTGLTKLVERLQGLDFVSKVEPEEAGLDASDARHSSPSGNKYLRAVLNDLEIREDDAIIDVGCGKGSAMRTMLAFPFSRIAGIELSKPIVEIARRNFRTLVGNGARCEIISGDAADFTNYDEYNYVYFYNPFTSEIMSQVVDNLIRSIVRKPRHVVVIYNTPACHDEIVRDFILSQVKEFPGTDDKRIVVYANARTKESSSI